MVKTQGYRQVKHLRYIIVANSSFVVFNIYCWFKKYVRTKYFCVAHSAPYHYHFYVTEW